MRKVPFTMSGEATTRPVPLAARGREPPPPRVPLAARWRPLPARLARLAGPVFILPAVLVILAFSIFPLLASLYVSLSRLSFSEGGVQLRFVGLDNYAKLVVGIDRAHFLGVTKAITPVSAAILAAVYAGFVYLLVRYARSRGRTALGLAGRSLVALIGGAGVWLVVDTILTSGRPGTLVVTIIYV